MNCLILLNKKKEQLTDVSEVVLVVTERSHAAAAESRSGV